MTTPKKYRQPPIRAFNNYVLTRETSSETGLMRINDSAMQTIWDGDNTTASTVLNTFVKIGFPFVFDQQSYSRCAVFEWMTLGLPATSWNARSEFITSVFSGSSVANTNIKSSFSRSTDKLLSSWFDINNPSARNIMFSSGSVTGSTFSTTAYNDLMKHGIVTPYESFDEERFGIKVHYGTDPKHGRRTVFRWTTSPSLELNGDIYVWRERNIVLRSDIVLYENGRVEMRYASRKDCNLNAGTYANTLHTGSATIGAFTNPNVFRDFSYGLGRLDEKRLPYRLGGTTYTAFTDPATATSWICSLRTLDHWPGAENEGSMFVFEPPKNLRRSLPRVDQRIVDSRQTYPYGISTFGRHGPSFDVGKFDDRRSPTYASVDINGTASHVVPVHYPTTLTRFHGGSSQGTTHRQDLFSSNFEVTASTLRGACDEFISLPQDGIVQPWNEHRLYENDPGNVDSLFYATGSLLEDVGLGMTAPLKSKQNVRLSFNVRNTTTMLSCSSCIYYLNVERGVWEIPQNSVSINFSDPPVPSDTDIATPEGVISGNVSVSPWNNVYDDYKGFGPIGNFVVSGAYRQMFEQSTWLNAEKITNALQATNTSSIQRRQINSEYTATTAETFKLPIDAPFVIEKAVFELPMAAGDKWFKDITTCTRLLSGTGTVSQSSPPYRLDFGGPGLTFALYNQRTFGDGTMIRDLILTGTITHQDDNVSSLNATRQVEYMPNTVFVSQRGFRSFGAEPSTVINYTSTSYSGLQFTGSAVLECTAQVSNGVMMMYADIGTGPWSDALPIFNKQKIKLSGTTQQHHGNDTAIVLAYIDNLGRGATGFDPSGRSVRGKEFTAYNVSSDGLLPNPFYISDGSGSISLPDMVGMPTAMSSTFAELAPFGDESITLLHGIVPYVSVKTSPYLVLPNDTLVMAIAKTRPVLQYENAVNGHWTSASIVHDVQLLTGTVGLTLYGCSLKEDEEIFGPLPQSIGSNAIHTVIGDDPVLDQFGPDYRELFYSGSSDDHIHDFYGGSLSAMYYNGFSTKRGLKNIIYNAQQFNESFDPTLWWRGRWWGNTKTRNAETLDSYYDIGLGGLYPTQGTFMPTSRYSEDSLPLSTQKVNIKFVQLEDESERFYDSMLPDISSMLSVYGTKFMKLSDNTTTSCLYTIHNMSGTNVVFFNCATGSNILTSSVINNDIMQSYPFEPMFSSLTRQRRLAHVRYACSYKYDSNINPSTVSAYNDENTQLALCFGGANPERVMMSGYDTAAKTHIRYLHDFYNRNKAAKALLTYYPAKIEDSTKAFFGYGDVNSMAYSGTYLIGSTHDVSFRNSSYDPNPPHARNQLFNNTFSGSRVVAPEPRGWKYGIHNGLPTFSKAIFRRDSYGQPRDMLEQRQYAKFYMSDENEPSDPKFKEGIMEGVVTVKFKTFDDRITAPENTWSQNLSPEATSSMPYLDGIARNRPPFNTSTANTSLVTLTSDQFNQLTL